MGFARELVDHLLGERHADPQTVRSETSEEAIEVPAALAEAIPGGREREPWDHHDVERRGVEVAGDHAQLEPVDIGPEDHRTTVASPRVEIGEIGLAGERVVTQDVERPVVVRGPRSDEVGDACRDHRRASCPFGRVARDRPAHVAHPDPQPALGIGGGGHHLERGSRSLTVDHSRANRPPYHEHVPEISPSSFDSKHFRSVLGHFPTGVTIVTGLHEGRPAGFTIGSFTSISLDPPLVGFFAVTSSDTWAAISGHGAFCVNVLRDSQSELCWRFAKTGVDDDRFDHIDWRPSSTGCPIIAGVGAWIDCRVAQTIELGDHYLVVGEVVDLDHHTTEHVPLVFYKGALGGFSSTN